MPASTILDFTAPYSAVESYVYDRLIAPAVIGMFDSAAIGLIDALPERAEVLEVGCGGGQLAVEIARRRPDLRWTGLDLSPDQIRRARRRGVDAGARVGFVEGNAQELPFDDDRFDAVVSVASVKHWPDPGRGLGECVRVLRPGGRLAVVEADRGCRLEDVRRFVRGWKIPPWTRPLALVFFRVMVAGQAFDKDDVRTFASELPLSEFRVEGIAGTPALMLSGTR